MCIRDRVWRGNVFDCNSANDEIVLLHEGNFSIHSAFVSCNNGAIVGRILRVEDNHYTSQINITLHSELIGADIKCSRDSGLSVTSVGISSMIIIKTGLHSINCAVHKAS